ncbi:MAG: hypothetical protein ACREYF_13645 [Gammaproteobacteria bacterium]
MLWLIALEKEDESSTVLRPEPPGLAYLLTIYSFATHPHRGSRIIAVDGLGLW